MDKAEEARIRAQMIGKHTIDDGAHALEILYAPAGDSRGIHPHLVLDGTHFTLADLARMVAGLRKIKRDTARWGFHGLTESARDALGPFNEPTPTSNPAPKIGDTA